MDEKLYVGAEGPVVILVMGKDVAEAIVSMTVLKPGETTETTWDAEVCVVDGIPQGIRHVLGKGDLTVPGYYRIQAIISTPDIPNNPSATAVLRVYNMKE